MNDINNDKYINYDNFNFRKQTSNLKQGRMIMFCKHNWAILSGIITKSKFESSLETIKKQGLSEVRVPHQLCCADRKVITILSCSKCGKLQKFVTSI